VEGSSAALVGVTKVAGQELEMMVLEVTVVGAVAEVMVAGKEDGMVAAMVGEAWVEVVTVVALLVMVVASLVVAATVPVLMVEAAEDDTVEEMVVEAMVEAMVAMTEGCMAGAQEVAVLAARRVAVAMEEVVTVAETLVAASVVEGWEENRVAAMEAESPEVQTGEGEMVAARVALAVADCTVPHHQRTATSSPHTPSLAQLPPQMSHPSTQTLVERRTAHPD
jgi:hypothetical protein